MYIYCGQQPQAWPIKSLYTLCFLSLIEPLIDSVMHRIPLMQDAEIRQMINGPESFTPDMHAALGEAPEVGCL